MRLGAEYVGCADDERRKPPLVLVALTRELFTWRSALIRVHRVFSYVGISLLSIRIYEEGDYRRRAHKHTL